MDLTTASRGELIHIIGELLSRIEAREARIAKLEGQQRPPVDNLRERKSPSWVKANRPARPKKERQQRAHGFARRREEPTHRMETRHGRLPPLPGAPAGRTGMGASPGDYPTQEGGLTNSANGR